MFDFNNPMSRGRSYPFAAGLDMSKLQPNPAAQARKPSAVDATAEGIAQVKRAMKLPAGVAASYNKKKTDCDPGEVSSRGVCKKKGRNKKASQDNSGQRLSSAGEESGVKYKIDTEGDKTGQSAFDTLDNYMKKAGLNSFQSNFFSRLVLEGANVEGAIKQAEDKFGEKVASELKSGFETLEKKAFWGLVRAAGSKLLGEGVKQTGKQLLGGGLKQIARKPGVAAKAMIRNIPSAAKNFVSGPGARGQLTQGATIGALNPYTGLLSENVMTDEGINYGNLIKSTLGGAIGMRGAGKLLSRPAMNALQQAGVRANVGTGVGLTGSMGANLLGADIDPMAAARLGFAGGAFMPKNLSNPYGIVSRGGRAGKAYAKAFDKLGPRAKEFLSRHLGSFTRNAGSAGAKNMKKLDPLSAADPMGTLTQIGLQKLGPYAGKARDAAVAGFGKLTPQQQQLAQAAGLSALTAGGTAAYMGNKMNQQANQFRQELQPYLDGAAYSMNRANEFMDNPIGGMLGGLGDTFQQNPWLLPLLLGGGGAALGGMAGGGTGATLGGIGLPLLYMMSQGKGLGDLFPGSQQNVAATQQQMANQDEATRAAQQAQNPVATQNTAQQDEFARQQAQQFAEANPGMMDGGMFDFTGYGQDEMAQLFAKASPQQQRILQDPSVPEDIKGKVLEVIAQG